MPGIHILLSIFFNFVVSVMLNGQTIFVLFSKWSRSRHEVRCGNTCGISRYRVTGVGVECARDFSVWVWCGMRRLISRYGLGVECLCVFSV